MRQDKQQEAQAKAEEKWRHDNAALKAQLAALKAEKDAAHKAQLADKDATIEMLRERELHRLLEDLQGDQSEVEEDPNLL